MSEIMSEIRVFPGVSWGFSSFEGDLHALTLTLKLIQMHGETQEAFLHRCQEVINHALRFVPRDTNIVDVPDMTAWPEQRKE